MTSSVYGLSHSTGPTRDWYASTWSLRTPIFFNSSTMSRTHSSISSLYGSPASSTYDTGTPCALKNTMGSSGESNALSGFRISAAMSSAIDRTYPGR